MAQPKIILPTKKPAQYTIKNVLSGSDSWQPVIKTESCAAPAVTINGNHLSWENVPYAICYVITRGDELIDIIKENGYTLDNATAPGDEPYTVQAVNEFGGLSAKGTATKADTPTGIDDITGTQAQVISAEIFDIRGIKHETLTNGVNIVKKNTL